MKETNVSSAGGTVKLSQGEEATIRVAGDRPLSKIVVGVGWDPALGGQSMDIDSAAIVAGGGSFEVVYFGNLTHPSGCVEHKGDNLTGVDGDDDGDDENIIVYLNKVPSDRDKIVFVLNIYKSYERCQSLKDVSNMYILLYDPATRRPLIEYRPDPAVQYDTAIVIGAVYRRGNDWTFRAIGKGSCAADVFDLAQEVVNKY